MHLCLSPKGEFPPFLGPIWKQLPCRQRCPCLPSWPKFCFFIYRPVFGINRVTYSNSCLAKSKGVKISCTRKCPCHPSRPKFCLTYRPVYGINGVTYSNSCLAAMKGVKVRYKRKCPCRFCPSQYFSTCLRTRRGALLQQLCSKM